MLTQTLLKLIVQVLVAVLRSLPSSSYWVENLLVDFDCGNLADTMDSICLTFNEYNDTHLHYAARAVRSASGEAPAATVTILDPRSQAGLPHAQATHLSGFHQLYHAQVRHLAGLSQLYHAQARHHPAKDITLVDQVSTEEDGKMALLSRQAAHTFVKTQTRRHRRQANTDNHVRFNIQDECCNYMRPRTCVLEEITEYCVEPEDGALLTW
uniref:Insulin-like androgenic gland hormone n=1 Tax=Procambarus virginalis TaxID=2065263 RepID=A0A2I6HQ27_9EUCA|nr:insulin-like androgenic gland hormone [Procambarus virginalis]